MRTVLALLTTLAAFGCTNVTPYSARSEQIEDRVPRSVRVLEDADAIQRGMDQARESIRAGL